MLRKIFKTGNSVVVALPKDAADFGLVEGGEAIVELDRAHKQIIIRPAEKAGISENFAQQVGDFIKRYRPALEALSKK